MACIGTEPVISMSNSRSGSARRLASCCLLAPRKAFWPLTLMYEIEVSHRFVAAAALGKILAASIMTSGSRFMIADIYLPWLIGRKKTSRALRTRFLSIFSSLSGRTAGEETYPCGKATSSTASLISALQNTAHTIDGFAPLVQRSSEDALQDPYLAI